MSSALYQVRRTKEMPTVGIDAYDAANEIVGSTIN